MKPSSGEKTMTPPMTAKRLQQVIDAMSGAYYGARLIPGYMARFPDSVTPDVLRSFQEGAKRLGDALGEFMPWVNRLLMSRNALERISDAIRLDPEEAGQWGRLSGQTLRLRNIAIHVTQALSDGKPSDGFPGAAGGDARLEPEEPSRRPSYETLKRRNMKLMALEALAGVTRPLSGPTQIIVDVTNRCNFRCRTCYQSANQNFVHHDLQGDALDSLLFFLPALSSITIGGTGEPLLNPDTIHLLKQAKAYGMNTELITNGSSLGRLKCIETDISLISLSMDGASPETVDSIRRGARFEKIIAGIRELPPALRSRIMFNMVVCRANVHEIHALARLAKELGIYGVGLQTFHAYLPWHEQMKLRDEDQPLLSQQIHASREELRGSGIALNVALIARDDAHPDTDDGVLKPDYLSILSSLDQTPNPKTPDKPGGWEEMAREFRESAAFDLPSTLISELSALRAGRTDAPAPDNGATLSDSEIDARMDELLRQLKASPGIKMPHCFAPYTLTYVNSDSTVKPCCVIKARCGSLDSDSAQSVWNSPAYVALRRSLVTGEDLPPECVGCQDGVRFAHATRLLGHAIGMGVDIGRVETPDDGCVPESVAAMVKSAKEGHLLKMASDSGAE